MQSVLQKLFNDPSKSEESKIQFLETIISKLPADNSKITFLNGTTEFLLAQSNVSSI